MTQPALTPNIQDLQQDVLELLQQVSDLLARSRTTLNADQYQRFEDAVNQEIEKVKNLELRMAIVAPMKAGKSTIINAIMGQDLLPSRNAAMTTVPTEIVFSQDVTEPTLTLDADFCEIFEKTLDKLKTVLNDSENNFSQHPHLNKLVATIKKKPEGKILPKSIGNEKIVRTLTGINDLVRLCNLVGLNYNPVEQLESCPRIEVKLDNDQLVQSGKLVIVDTPGPNEAGEHRLQEIVTDQLQKCSIVLLVLDFTQLKTQAAEKIKESVHEITQIKGGSESLYVLVNKVDQRRKRDMTTDEVAKFVTGEFGIERGSTNRVFEIAARRAFCANNARKYLNNLNSRNALDKKNKVIQALAEEIYGIDWEDDLQEADIDELKSKAEKLWKKSGFSLFTENAIQALLQEAAPRCISTALNVTSSSLERLRDTVGLRAKGIAKDAGMLQEQVEHIQRDLRELKNCQDRLKNFVTQKVNDLKKNTETILKEAKVCCEERTTQYFLEYQIDKLEDPDFISQLKKMDLSARKLLLKPINIGGLGQWVDRQFPAPLANIAKYDIALFGAKKIGFKTKREAEQFFQEIMQEVTQIVDSILSHELDQVQGLFFNTRESLYYHFAESTELLVTAARNRLSEEFDLALSIPDLQLEAKGIGTVDMKLTILPRKKNIFSSAIDTVLGWFGHRSSEYDRFNVDLKDITQELQANIKSIIADIQKDIDRYVDKDFSAAMKEYFTALKKYLEDFRTSLEESLEDKQRSSIERQEVETQLENTLNETNQILEKVRQKKTMLTPLLSNKKPQK